MKMLLVFLLLIPFLWATPANEHARISLISSDDAVVPGSTAWLGLRFELEPGWHIYWQNPGDSGEPPKVSWQLPAGFSAGELVFPAPHRIADHSLVDYGYQNQVVLLSKVNIPANASSKEAIAADVKYLVCREICVPGRARVSLDLRTSGRAQASAAAALLDNARQSLPRPMPAGVRLSAKSTKDSFVLMVMGTKGTPLANISDFIPADPGQIENTAKPAIHSEGSRQEITLKKSDQLSQPVRSLRGLLIAGTNAYDATFPVRSGSSRPARSPK